MNALDVRQSLYAAEELRENLVAAAMDYTSMSNGHAGLGGWCVAMAHRMQRLHAAMSPGQSQLIPSVTPHLDALDDAIELA